MGNNKSDALIEEESISVMKEGWNRDSYRVPWSHRIPVMQPCEETHYDRKGIHHPFCLAHDDHLSTFGGTREINRLAIHQNRPQDVPKRSPLLYHLAKCRLRQLREVQIWQEIDLDVRKGTEGWQRRPSPESGRFQAVESDGFDMGSCVIRLGIAGAVKVERLEHRVTLEKTNQVRDT